MSDSRPEHRHEPSPCLICGTVMDAATPTDESHKALPAKNDVSLCFVCASLAIYTGVGHEKRFPTADERAELAGNLEVQHAVQTLIDMRDKDKDWPKPPGRT